MINSCEHFILGFPDLNLLEFHIIYLLGVPLFLGLVRGDIKSMFSYNDHPEEAETEEKKKDN